MILYNWKKIYKKSKGNPKKILLIVKYITYRPLPNNKDDIVFQLYGINWSGNSFLLRPEKIFENIRDYSHKELAEYVGLASFRSYAEYKVNKKTTIDLLHCPVKIDTINNNRLLTIENDVVHFKWEDTEKK